MEATTNPASAMTPLRTLVELEDISDTSSTDSGEWTDLSSALPDDASDPGSLDGEDPPPRPVSALDALEDGSEDAWTAAEAVQSPTASVYSSGHTPLNPFATDEHSARDSGPYGMYGPLNPFHEPSEVESQRGGPGSAHELELILPDPLERSDSTVAADLSFSDDAVLATGPTAVVSLTGAHPSIAQRATVVADILFALSKATRVCTVRADYQNFTTLSALPTRVKNHEEPVRDIAVLVRDCTTDVLTPPPEDIPSILVVFTSDTHDITLPPVSNHTILVPIVLNDARPVVLFDDRDERAPDDTVVDIHDLVRKLSNFYAHDHHSDTATQTAVDTLGGGSVASEFLDEALLNTDYDTPDEREEVVPIKRETSPVLIGDGAGPELSDALKRFGRNVSPRWTAACALAVVFSLLLGTGHLIQRARPLPSPTTVNTPGTNALTPILHQPSAETGIAVKSAHTSLALKSSQTSVALKSPHTSLAVKSSHTSLAVKSEHTSLAPLNDSCSSQLGSSSVPIAGPSSVYTSILSTATVSAASTSTSATAAEATPTQAERTNILADVVEDLSSAMDRIERVLGWNVRETISKVEANAHVKSVADAVLEAASVIDPAGVAKAVHGRHQDARKGAERNLAGLKKGMSGLGEKVGFAGKQEAKKAKKSGKEKTGKAAKGKDGKEKARSGRDKWQTTKDHAAKPGQEEKGKAKAKLPNREENEKPQSAKRAKKPTTDSDKDKTKSDPLVDWAFEDEWTWEPEVEFEFGPRRVVEEVREYFYRGAMPYVL